MNPNNQPDLNPANGQHLDAAHPDPWHLDAEIINAFIEHQLPEPERGQALSHLATCSHCRQIVYLARQAAEAEFGLQAEQAVDEAFAAQTRNEATYLFKQLLSWPSRRLPAWQFATLAAAACFALVAVSVWFYPHPHQSQSQLDAQKPTPAPQQDAALIQPANPYPEPKPASKSEPQVEPKAERRSAPSPISSAKPVPEPPRQRAAAPTPGSAGASLGVIGGIVALPPAAAPNLPATAAAPVAPDASPSPAIAGRVQDSSGAVIPNAQVELTETATNRHEQTSTSNTGDYAFTHLNPGSYRIDVNAPGFQHLIRNAEINQTVAQTPTQTNPTDLILNPGSASETVTVASDSAMLQTETKARDMRTPAIDATISAQQIQQLPLEARNSAKSKKTKVAPALPSTAQPGAVAGAAASSAGAQTVTRSASAGFASTPRQAALAKRVDPSQIAQLAQLTAANALLQPLPNGQKPLATAAVANTLLAVDSTGALLLSNDTGKTWQTIPQQWTGPLISLRLAPITQSQDSLNSLDSLDSSKGKNPARQPEAQAQIQAPPPQFEIVTSQHTVYLSADGHVWKPR